jgi:hypothetical protein
MAHLRCAPLASVAHLLAWHTPPAPSSNKKSPPSVRVALLCAPPRRFAATHRAFCLALPPPSFTGRHDNLVAPISHACGAGLAEQLLSHSCHYCSSRRAILRSAFFVTGDAVCTRTRLRSPSGRSSHLPVRGHSHSWPLRSAGLSPAARARRRAAAASALPAATKRQAENRPVSQRADKPRR